MEAAHVLPHGWPDHAPTPADSADAAAADAAVPPPEGAAALAATDGEAGFEAGPMNDRDRRVLEFERHWWRYAGAKEKAIRAEFGLSATRYYQVLNVLIDTPEALVADPMLVRRLRRLRTQRRRSRAGQAGALERADESTEPEGAGR